MKKSLLMFFWLNFEKTEKYKFGNKKIITELKRFLEISKLMKTNK